MVAPVGAMNFARCVRNLADHQQKMLPHGDAEIPSLFFAEVSKDHLHVRINHFAPQGSAINDDCQ